VICEPEVLEVSEYILCVSNGSSVLCEIDVVGEEFVLIGVEELPKSKNKILIVAYYKLK